LVTFDLGATKNGAVADAARTFIFGEPKEKRHQQLVDDCREALKRAIEAVEVGKRLGAIGHTIYRYGRDKGYGVINNYGGHSVSFTENESGEKIGVPHAPPFVANKAEPNEGVRLQPNMTLCIEPQFTLGSTTTSVANDGWTVECPALSSHEEDTIFIHSDRVEVITAWN